MPTTRVHRTLHAPRWRVFGALTDPEAIATWRVPAGMTAEVHEFDARVGGVFRISLTYDSPDRAGKSSAHTDTYHGHFAEIVPDERVVEVLEFETDDPVVRGEMRLSITLRDNDGGTELTAEHDGLPPGVAPDDNELGWTEALDRLARLVDHG
ncbi:SRPBCC family protein [Rhodococcus sp. ACT016]|uniref:SRPBCC family protein n=1 Tax=Rhodococcus sp. ACT016 TaxID=3134808 RepID=UPI003D293656